MKNVIIISSCCPIALFCWCVIYWIVKTNSKNRSLEEEKNFYWLKNSSKKLVEKDYSIGMIILRGLYLGIIIGFYLLIIALVDGYNFLTLKSFISIEAFWNILGMDIQILTIVSLVTVLKKDFYLGITIKEVMKAYRIPNLLMKVLIYSCIIFFGYGMYNVSMIRNSEYVIFVEFAIYSLVLVFLVNLIILIYRTIVICLCNSKKEIETFKCLRYKIAFEYQVEQEEPINGNMVEKISTYLVNEVKKYYKSFKEKSNSLVEVQYGSGILGIKDNLQKTKEYNRRFRIIGLVPVVLLVMSYFGVLLLEEHASMKGNWKLIGIIIVQIVVTVILIIIGSIMNAWNIFAVNRSFFVFKYEKKGKIEKKDENDSQKEKIAAFGWWWGYRKRYEFIGAIEDLISFYKILIYNKQGKKAAYIVIRQIEEKIKEEEKIKNAILLLLYYFSYEKYYIKTEAKVNRKIKEKNKQELVRRKTEEKIEKKKIYDYDEMKIWMKKISKESVEYQLADSILKEAYKEPEIKENGEINPEKLRNYKFEYYFDFISNKVGNFCSKDKPKNENSNFSEKSNSVEAIK